MEKNVIGVGLLGYGTVGEKVLEFLYENREKIQKEHGIELRVIGIYVRNKKRKRPGKNDVSNLLTENWKDITQSKKVDICVECLGGAGTETAYQAVMEALENGCEVVMSSKKCLALYGKEIFEEAQKRGKRVRFEGTTEGAVPVCRALEGMARGEKVKSVYGIVNATSNFVLTEMTNGKCSYEEALKKAQKKGYAENDPADDVDGIDSANKLNILLRLAMGVQTDVLAMEYKTIREITERDVNIALNRGNVIKPLIYAELLENGTIGYYVGPVEIAKSHFLAGVSENYNMVFTDSEKSALRAFYGKGAGGKETASAVYDDIIALSTGSKGILEHYVYGRKELTLLSEEYVARMLA